MAGKLGRSWRLLLPALCLVGASGCHLGVTQNPSYFPWFIPTGDIIPTHARPPGLGYYANFDPYAKRLEVRPISHVVPVQTQHVLMATVYGETKPLRKRRVEWFLQGEGNIVQVDEAGVFPGRGYQKDGKYAVSYTNYGYNRMTRGNNDPRDDFMLRPGQSWCVVSSAVEGDTYITVVAPGVYDWEQRKRVVNIKWVDAQWQFPESARARTGSQYVLTTRLFRHTDKQPLANYKVRYRIIDGPPAVLLPNQTREAVVVSDLEGNAQVAITQAAPAPGYSRVEVEIIRPPDPTKPSGSGLVLAKGITTIEWLAPKVEIRVSGPPRAPIGGDIPCSITVSNAGKIATRTMTVTSTIPQGIQYVSSRPQASRVGNDLIWTFGPLEPGQAHPPIEVVYRGQQTGTLRSCASVKTEDGQTDEECVNIEITRPGIRIDIQGPQTGVVGVPVTFDVTLSNPGSGVATDVLLQGKLSEGLEPQGVAPGSKSRTVKSQQKPLAGGESRRIPLVVVPRLAGQQLIQVAATAAGGLQDTAETRILIVQPQIDVKLNGPRARYTGRPAEWNIRVVNPSNVPLENVMIRDKLPAGLTFDGATGGGIVRNGDVVWDLGTLAPGQERIVQLTTRCGAAAGFVTHKVQVTSNYGLREEDAAALEIKALPAALRMELIDVGDPAPIGNKVLYKVQVTNIGAKSVRNVQIVTNIPKEMKLVRAQGDSGSQTRGQTVSFQKIAEVKPNQTVEFEVEAVGVKAGAVRFESRLFTDLLSHPIVETESTHIVDPSAPRLQNPQPVPRPVPRIEPPPNRNNGGATPTLPRNIVPPVAPPPVPK